MCVKYDVVEPASRSKSWLCHLLPGNNLFMPQLPYIFNGDDSNKDYYED